MTYQKMKHTMYQGNFIEVIIGLIQGCAFGPGSCGLALSELIQLANDLLKDLDENSFNVNLMDDMTFGGDEVAIVKTAMFLSVEGPEKYGAIVNPPKTIVYVLDPELKVPEIQIPNAKRIVATGIEGIDVGSKREEDGTRLLGSPVGSIEFCEKFTENLFQTKYSPILQKIMDIRHPPTAWRLFQRLSISGGLIHLFRSTTPRLIAKPLPKIEARIREFAGIAIFGRNLTDQEWEICQLPFSLGGWNMVPFDVLSPCAYLASLLANKTAVLALRPDAGERIDRDIKATVELILKNDPSTKLPDLKSTTKQKDLVRAVMETRAEKLLQRVDPRTKALLLGMRQDHASSWKTVEHTAETFMDPEVFQTAALFSIGSEFLTEERLCPVCEKVYMDTHADHALICMNEGTVVKRHNDLYNVFVKEAREAFIGLGVEKKINIDERKTYTADILLSHGIPGLTNRRTALDLTITCNFNKTMIKRSAKEELAAAMAGETRKEKEQKSDLEKLGYDFIPLAFEATGGHSPTVAPIAHYFLSQKAIMTGIPFEELAHRFWQRLAVSLQRSNASAILERQKRSLPLPQNEEP